MARIPWVRILGEGLTIVVSILLAFGIQAWWEGRTAADQEQRLLLALRSEFVENRQLLEEAGSEYRTRYMAASEILEAVEAPSAPIDQSDLARLVQELISAQTFHLESGAHDALLASGDLAVITNEVLRSRLAAWPSFVAEWLEEEEAVFSFAQEELVPFLSVRASLRKIQPPLRPFPDGDQLPPLPPSHGELPSFEGLLGEVEFENLVQRSAQGSWYATRDAETLLVRLAEILDLLEAAIEL